MTTTMSFPTGPAATTPDPSPAPDAYGALLSLLSARSTTKRFDAYRDVAWDDPENRVESDDPRFELASSDPLEQTDWYRSLPQPARARLGLHLIASRMRTGIHFENVLSQGLLEFAMTRPNRSPEFRYAMHEIIEEGQHSLMFQEFVNRSGVDPVGLSGVELALARRVPRLGRGSPERFFLHVLAGEAPIDHVQKTMLAGERPPHPLLRRIMQIHVTEEARHICFASRFLTEYVPRMGAIRRAALRVAAPFIVGGTMLQMMRLPPDVVVAHRIPRAVVRQVSSGARYREQVLACLRPIRALCIKLGLLDAGAERLWVWFGLAPSRTAAL